jgi:hypothetical protein
MERKRAVPPRAQRDAKQHSSGFRSGHEPGTSLVLFIWLIIRLIQLVFSAEIIIFSHKKSANSVFQPAYNSSRTAPLVYFVPKHQIKRRHCSSPVTFRADELTASRKSRRVDARPPCVVVISQQKRRAPPKPLPRTWTNPCCLREASTPVTGHTHTTPESNITRSVGSDVGPAHQAAPAPHQQAAGTAAQARS